LTPLTGQTVVETTTVSVIKKISRDEAGQFETLDGQAVIVDVLVDNTVEVVYSISDLAAVVVGRTISRTGQTVVDRTRVSVVRNVLCDLAGQFSTSGGHAVTVVVRVEKTVEVLNRTVGVMIAQSKVVAVTSEGIEIDEERTEGEREEGIGETSSDTVTVLEETDVVLEEATLEAADTASEDFDTPELVEVDVAVFE
jgi:dihydroneopterin aldolase